jgi:hypothetical protein
LEAGLEWVPVAVIHSAPSGRGVVIEGPKRMPPGDMRPEQLGLLVKGTTWVEEKHPRHQAGATESKGGQFAPGQRVTGVHYSQQDQGESFTLDPTHYGEGKAGRERVRVKGEGAPPRSYAYGPGAEHEPLVAAGGHKYHVGIDPSKTPRLEVRPGETATQAELRVRGEGMTGYQAPENSTMPDTYALFDPTQAKRATDYEVGITAYGQDDGLKDLYQQSAEAFFEATEPQLQEDLAAPGIVVERLERGEGVYMGEGEPTHVLQLSSSEDDVLWGRLARYAKRHRQFAALTSHRVSSNDENATPSVVLSFERGMSQDAVQLVKDFTAKHGLGATFTGRGAVFHFVPEFAGKMDAGEHATLMGDLMEALDAAGHRHRASRQFYRHRALLNEDYDSLIARGEQRERELKETRRLRKGALEAPWSRAAYRRALRVRRDPPHLPAKPAGLVARAYRGA